MARSVGNALVRLALVLLLVAPALPVWGQGAEVYLDVRKEGSGLFVAAIPPFESGAGEEAQRLAGILREVLRQDLDVAGFFRLLNDEPLLQQLESEDRAAGAIRYPEWQSTGARLLIKGKVEAEASRVSLQVGLYDAATRTARLSKTYGGSRETHRLLAHRASNDVMQNLFGEAGIADTRIAFLGYYQGHKEVFVMDYDGFNVEGLTRDRSVIVAPRWAPDARRLFYTSYRDRNPDLYQFSLANGQSQPVFRFPGINAMPAWSPDGKEMAVVLSKDGNPEVYLANADGSNLRRLTNNRDIDSAPTWSTDGKHIYFTSDRAGSPQIFAMDRNGDNVRRITFTGTFNDLATWSPRGDLIAFVSRVNGAFQIALMNPDGSGMRYLTGASGSSESPSWSPDGRLLCFSSTRNGVSNLYLMRTDGTGLRQITTFRTGAFSPSWSPRPKQP
ncbi:MAG: Tol-Pal system beta propeller repeat protein TolB [Candidatus Tectomicrobia bacterium]|nr:Tol-Pal system beta propeller repeat protein TolB [Candidatus Tectomicrobia bacterium]